MRNPQFIQTYSLYVMHHFSLVLFQIFFFVISLKKEICLSVGFGGLALGFNKHLSSVSLYFAKFGKHSTISSSNSFSSLHPF